MTTLLLVGGGESGVSLGAEVRLVAALLLFTAGTTAAGSGGDTGARGSSSAERVRLRFQRIVASGGGGLESVHLCLTSGTQSGLALVLGGALVVEGLLLLVFAGLSALEQLLLAIADGLLGGASVQSFVLVLVSAEATLASLAFAVVLLASLVGRKRDSLVLQASLELGLLGGLQVLEALGVRAGLLAARLATGAGSTLRRWGTFVVGVAFVHLGLELFEFGFHISAATSVGVFQAFVKVGELLRAILGTETRADGTSGQ